MENHYLTIEENSTAEFKDRGSKFIGIAMPLQSVEDFKNKMKIIKTEHPKADHFCFAYRIGIDKNTFRISDAGEPSGSAGKQILGQIDSNKLTNVLVVVIRYFGGTLLGVPGLINAYKTSASFALQTVPMVRKELVTVIKIEFNYNHMNDIIKSIKQFRGIITKMESSLFSIIEVEIPKSEEKSFKENIGRLQNVTLQ